MTSHEQVISAIFRNLGFCLQISLGAHHQGRVVEEPGAGRQLVRSRLASRLWSDLGDDVALGHVLIEGGIINYYGCGVGLLNTRQLQEKREQNYK